MTSGHITSARKPSWWDADPEPIESASPVAVTVDTPEPGPARALPPDDPDERAALIEIGADIPRAWAEGYAALCTMKPPAGFWPDHWRRVIDAAGAFLDRWAGEAARCGWSALDVFGCDAGAPTARFDCMGL